MILRGKVSGLPLRDLGSCKYLSISLCKVSLEVQIQKEVYEGGEGLKVKFYLNYMLT